MLMVYPLENRFLPTPSARRATPAKDAFHPRCGISTHALREEGDTGALTVGNLQVISTHALREEGDGWPRAILTMVQHFYPRPPRGGRLGQAAREADGWQFLPTPSARRATGRCVRGRRLAAISTHALREEGDQQAVQAAQAEAEFLPTPSARRATVYGRNLVDLTQEFLPTPSARRATAINGEVLESVAISTHALREEGDFLIFIRFLMPFLNFYPRPPRGGRRPSMARCWNPLQFLPTPSARRATAAARSAGTVRAISTHALREEGDPHLQGGPALGGLISTHALREEGDHDGAQPRPPRRYFYPRPPRGGRPAAQQTATQTVSISTHALREEGDVIVNGSNAQDVDISTHALREEGDGQSAGRTHRNV